MRLSATGLTLPWQAVAAQEPGPTYFASVANGLVLCAPRLMANTVHAPQRASASGKMRWAAHGIAEKRELFRMQALRRASLLSLVLPGSQRN
jgi:hypothetical protein